MQHGQKIDAQPRVASHVAARCSGRGGGADAGAWGAGCISLGRAQKGPRSPGGGQRAGVGVALLGSALARERRSGFCWALGLGTGCCSDVGRSTLGLALRLRPLALGGWQGGGRAACIAARRRALYDSSCSRHVQQRCTSKVSCSKGVPRGLVGSPRVAAPRLQYQKLRLGRGRWET